ncbi:GcrA family cell cycle regulator [Ahrensia marina]|jgi:GcrA cell cycle regulator|uniref:GcrA family cell cycle regulator n=1 Tax=Ahrensia marina TaxID=1514904 RepID=UPI0035D095BF
MAWTDERVEVLKTMWLGGSSASQIAAALGDVTRNAVIGKVHRLGLSGRGKPTSTATPRARKPRAPSSGTSRPRRSTTTARVGGGAGVSVGATALKSDEMAVATLEQAPVARGNVDLVLVGESPKLSIQELKEDTCRWPVGDPMNDDFHFCGRSALDGQPYCEYHCGVAFQAPNERRRDRNR